MAIPDESSLTSRNVEAFLAEMLPSDPKSGEGASVVVSMDHVRSIERVAGLVVSAALLSCRNRDLQFRWNSRLAAPLAQCGITFALAHRQGRTQVENKDRLRLEEWRPTWTPGSKSYRHRMLEGGQLAFPPELMGESDEGPVLVGPFHAAFINAHLVGARGGQTEVARLVPPWLNRLLGASAEPAFVHQIAQVVDELLDNVRDHGATQSDGNQSESLVQVAVTHGEPDRVHLAVLDTGPGIATTLRRKVATPALSEKELLSLVFEGKLPQTEYGRGMGLPFIARAIREHRGALLRVHTGKLRLTVGEDIAWHPEGFPLLGTLVVATFPISKTHQK